jgi:hypothetical protein
MPQNVYDRTGRLIGYSKSDAEVAAEGAALAGLALLAILIAPFLPILLTAYWMIEYLVGVAAWHPLFAIIFGVILAVACLSALWHWAWARIAYFGAEVLCAAFFTFLYIGARSDEIWASAAAIVVAVFGFGLMAWIEGEMRGRI